MHMYDCAKIYVHYALILSVFADDFSDETVIIAIQNERACNAVLRAQANGVLSLVDSYVDTLHVVYIY